MVPLSQTISVSWESYRVLPKWFGSGSHEAAIKMSMEGFSSEMVPSQVWQIGTGSWQEASVPHHMNLSGDYLKCPHDTVAGFTYSKVKATYLL